MSHRGVAFVFSAVLAALISAAGAATALAHDVSTAQGHLEEDIVPPLSPATERQYDQHTMAVTAGDAAIAAATTGSASQVGQWGPVVNWPVVAVHMALLENGEVLAYDSMGDNATETYATQDHTRATLWDPATGAQTPVDVNTGYNVFCSGLAHIMDGRVFLAGGTKDQQLDGIVQTHIFDPASNTWSLGPNMAAPRWYPSVTPLADGETLITSGRTTGANVADVPEVRKIEGGLRALNTASLGLALYPWLDVAPDGRAFLSGPAQTMMSLDTAGGGAWQTLGQRDGLYRDYGSHAMYDVGKILVAGGGYSSNDARVINLNGGTPQVSPTAPMAYGRRQFNLTVLADGTVLATGGNSSGAQLVDLNNGVYPAELWNPATGTWRTLAAMRVTRQYHSTALLLPDGRVLSAGGGICGTCDQVGYLAKNAEVFSPPYLFTKNGALAPRPQISSVPNRLNYNAPFAISTPNASSIQKVALVRLGAVTHSVNMEQRYVPLSFTAGTGTLTAAAPANADVAPPGVYMLFVIDANGVPSVARMVRVGKSPTVSFVRPTENAAEVLPNAPIVVAFNTSMDKPSAERAFSLKRTSDGAPVSGAFGWYGNALIFKPNADMAGGTQYTASVSTAAQNLGGFPLAAPKTWQFTTTNRPIIDRVSPADGATDVSRGALTIVYFNKAMDKAATQAAFSLKRTSDGAPVSGAFGWYGNALIFKPNTDLDAGTQYTATVSGAAKDLGGNMLANPVTWRYTTGAAG
jgi:Galactose oxidase-like, Early set domain/Bacterial Ig-like domain